MYDKSYSVQIVVDIAQSPVTLKGKDSRTELLEKGRHSFARSEMKMITADRWQLAASLLRDDTPELVALRQRVRLWLEQHTPHGWRNRIDRISKPELRRWHRMVAEAGFAAPHWPKSVGGMEASLREQLVIAEEWAVAGAPHLMNMPLRFLAPGLMKFGTDAQKKFFLPRILSGEMFFCQLYSESEAGSDLGNIRTTARIEGDRFIVTGTKLWSTAADYADWGLLWSERAITICLVPEVSACF